MKRVVAVVLSVVVCLGDSGCAMMPEGGRAPPDPAKVVGAVKDELNFLRAYMEEHPINLVGDGKDICASKSNGAQEISPDEAKVTLKFVAATSEKPSAGLGDPVTGIKIDPSYSKNKSISDSQSMEF